MSDLLTILAVLALLTATIWYAATKAWPAAFLAGGLLCWLLSTGVHIST